MSILFPTQQEADSLIAMEKHYHGSMVFNFPLPSERCVVPLISADKKHGFQLDINRGRIKLTQATFQTRTKEVVVLVRLDVDGRPHTNPDDEVILSPHIHLYREGFHDKWAYPLPLGVFSDLSDLFATLDDFMAYCKIVSKPSFQKAVV